MKTIIRFSLAAMVILAIAGCNAPLNKVNDTPTYYVQAWSIRGAPFIDYGALRRETSGSPQFYARLAANQTGATYWYPSGEPAGLNENYLKMLPGIVMTNLETYYGAELNSEMTFPDDVDPEGSVDNAGGWSIARDATRGCMFWNFKYRQ